MSCGYSTLASRSRAAFSASVPTFQMSAVTVYDVWSESATPTNWPSGVVARVAGMVTVAGEPGLSSRGSL